MSSYNYKNNLYDSNDTLSSKQNAISISDTRNVLDLVDSQNSNSFNESNPVIVLPLSSNHLSQGNILFSNKLKKYFSINIQWNIVKKNTLVSESSTKAIIPNYNKKNNDIDSHHGEEPVGNMD